MLLFKSGTLSKDSPIRGFRILMIFIENPFPEIISAMVRINFKRKIKSVYLMGIKLTWLRPIK